MEEKIYLIYIERMDDGAEIKGIIIGNEEKANSWCEKYNEISKDYYDTVQWTEVKILNDSDIDKEFEKVYYIESGFVRSIRKIYLPDCKIEGIDRDGKYFSTKEKAVAEMGKSLK